MPSGKIQLWQASGIGGIGGAGGNAGGLLIVGGGGGAGGNGGSGGGGEGAGQLVMHTLTHVPGCDGGEGEGGGVGDGEGGGEVPAHETGAVMPGGQVPGLEAHHGIIAEIVGNDPIRTAVPRSDCGGPVQTGSDGS
jgi:hypothetical protein